MEPGWSVWSFLKGNQAGIMLRFALRFISYDKPKSIGVILGIVISIFLVGQQTGIFLFLTGAMSSLVNNTKADIWVVDNRTTNVNALGPIDIRIGYQIESLPGVKKAYPLVIAGGSAKFRDGKSAPVQIIGSLPPSFRGGPWNIVKGSLDNLIDEGAVSSDVFDKKNLNNADLGTQFEINGKRVIISVQTRGVRSFGGIFIFTTDSRARELGKIPKNKVSAFLIDVEEGADPLAIRDYINRTLFGVRAWTKKEFSRATVSTILSTSGIAFSIGTLIIFAAISGMIIIGLTMYSAAVDRLRDYGTLKAIGADNTYIRNLILTQAIFFALTGYGIAIILIQGFQRGIANSGVLFNYSTAIKIAFFIVTILISLGGAAFAMHRIARLEPASVFRA
ncbi:MAG: ABC transporter permease [Candidatus Aminicenantaceae bacterium]